MGWETPGALRTVKRWFKYNVVSRGRVSVRSVTTGCGGLFCAPSRSDSAHFMWTWTGTLVVPRHESSDSVHASFLSHLWGWPFWANSRYIHASSHRTRRSFNLCCQIFNRTKHLLSQSPFRFPFLNLPFIKVAQCRYKYITCNLLKPVLPGTLGSSYDGNGKMRVWNCDKVHSKKWM